MHKHAKKTNASTQEMIVFQRLESHLPVKGQLGYMGIYRDIYRDFP